MRKRGSNLDSPEANFMFGGPDNEQIYESPDGQAEPYDKGTAAVDSMISDGRIQGPPADILTERDKRIGQIDKSLPQADEIEEQRKQVAKKINELRKPKDS
jgi:hypothetical protein